MLHVPLKDLCPFEFKHTESKKHEGSFLLYFLLTDILTTEIIWERYLKYNRVYYTGVHELCYNPLFIYLRILVYCVGRYVHGEGFLKLRQPHKLEKNL